jgi:hypothetical protein
VESELVIELARRVLTNVKKEGADKSVGSSSPLPLPLSLMSRALKASSKSLLLLSISPLKLAIYYL